jgi:hypothetical protein
MWHVYPENDLKEHDLNGTMCDCDPRVITEDLLIVVHNSFDGRESILRARQILGIETKTIDGWRGVEVKV